MHKNSTPRQRDTSRGDIPKTSEATDEALVVQFEYPQRVGTVDRSESGKLDVSIQPQRKVLKSVGVGLLVGVGTGAMLGLTGAVVGLIVGLVRRHRMSGPPCYRKTSP